MTKNIFQTFYIAYCFVISLACTMYFVILEIFLILRRSKAHLETAIIASDFDGIELNASRKA